MSRTTETPRPEWEQIPAIAARLGIHGATIRRWIRDGRLPASKPGGVLLVRAGAVEELLEKSMVGK